MKKIVVFGDSIAAGLYQGEQKRLLDYFMLQYLNRSEKNMKLSIWERKATVQKQPVNVLLKY